MSRLFRAAVAAVLALVCMSGCGGGGGGGGGGGPQYSISVSPATVSFSGVTQGEVQTQNVTVTFRGDGVVVGTLPGQAQPPWLFVSGPTQGTSPITIAIQASPDSIGTFQTTLRFATGKADGSQVVTTDVPISFNVVQGARTTVWVKGLARTSSFALRQNTGTPVTVNEDTFRNLPALAVGSAQTVAVSTQPTGQTCTFDDGSTSVTGPVTAPLLEHHLTCHASLLPWTWRGGSQARDVAAVYGTKGVPAATVGPGGRAPAAHAVDAAGNLWLFGGSDTAGAHNDLWKYDPNAATWTWVSGSDTPNASGMYGTKGTPDAGNVPGARALSTGWTDAAGNFWLLGGFGATAPGFNPGFLNDLWVFDVASGNWTWVGGSDVADAQGTYGVAPSTSNIPGGRQNAAAVKDGAGKVWFFGGYGLGEINSFGRMNDLWTFDPASRVWTWLKGENEPNNSGVYGTRGVPDIANVPRGRDGVALSVDSAGDLWLFGGADSTGFNNDLWRYHLADDAWTWMSGADASNPNFARSPGNYLPPGTTMANLPSSRYLAAAWRDAAGNLWIFGGNGIDGTTIFGGSAGATGFLSDLWKYETASNTWTWLSGSNVGSAPSVFGTQGIAAVANTPAGRVSGAAWADGNGAFHLYGGASSPNADQRLADFWKFTPQ